LGATELVILLLLLLGGIIENQKFGPRYAIKLDDEKSYGNLRKLARVRRAHAMH
jgi:hypothetical protein